MENSKYIHREEIHNLNAPSIIVPYLIEKYNPQSVLDVGTGLGTWLSVFEDYGVKEIKGLDGDWVEKSRLKIKLSEFETIDLTKGFSQSKKYDLVLCLEVAEHLEEQYADNFIKELTNCSDLIVFSAAVPEQQGQNHVNEKSPIYWDSLLNESGFYLHEDFREKFWYNESIEWWYRQNILVYKKTGKIDPVEYKKPIYKIHYELWNEELKRKQDYLNRLKSINEGRVTWKYILKIIYRKLIKFKPNH